mgnify:FL=1
MTKSASSAVGSVYPLFLKDLKDSYVKIKNALERIPTGGQIIIDVRKCTLVDPAALLELVTRLRTENSKRKGGLLKGRHIIVLGPNEGVELLLTWILKEIHCSLIVAFPDAKSGSKWSQKVLNLQEYLSHPLKFIESREGTTARELDRHLHKGYKTPARNCLRQLFRRGLVAREGSGGSEERPHFIYRAVKLQMLQ